MRKLFSLAVLATAALVVFGPAAASAATPTCPGGSVTVQIGQTTKTYSVYQMGGDVTGTLDAGGCDIGVYYDGSNTGDVDNANISDATHYGVFVYGGHVDVTGSEIHQIGDNPFDGGQHADAIYYENGARGTISGNDVFGYQKGGIVVNGAGTSATVTHNTVTGLGPVDFIAQNGIQFGYGATGSANNNTVDGNWYTGPYWASTGILIFESDGVSVSHNTVGSSQFGIDAETWCWVRSSASNNSFSNNTVSGAEVGVSVAAYWVSGVSTCDAVADNNKIANNVVSGTNDAGSTGVFVGAWASDDSHTPEATNTKVIHNKVDNFDVPYDLGSSNATKARADTPIP